MIKKQHHDKPLFLTYVGCPSEPVVDV